MRGLALALAAVLVGVPALAVPSWPPLVAAIPAAALLAGAIVVRSVAVLTAGILAAMAGYTAALALTAASPDPVTATVLGMTIALLVQVVDFTRRFRGVAVTGDAMAAEARYLVRTAVLTSTGTAIIGTLGLGLSYVLPPLAAPALAGAGALAVVVGGAAVAAGRRPGHGRSR